MTHRPEKQAPADIHYNDVEARKYAANSRMIKIQSEMTRRAVELLELPAGKRCSILDIGCGSGLSGEVLTSMGHHWTGVDIAPSMLGVALQRGVRGDLLCADIGQGLFFRAGTFDAAISISVIQWLCNADRSEHVPQRRLRRFFQSLYNCLTRGARAVLQFYPETPAQMTMITKAAMACGFGGGIVIDNPEAQRTRKYYLVLVTQGANAVIHHQRGAAADEEDVPMGPDGTPEQIQFTTGVAKSVERKSRRQSRRKKGNARGSKSWIQAKKERMRKQGRKVARDSKYTARRRGPKF